MAAKSRTTIDEYLYLNKRIQKLRQDAEVARPLARPRIRRKIRQLLKRQAEIREIHEDEGWPHPESFTPEARERERKYKDTISQFGNLDPMACKAATSPDGSLFKTPVMPGSILDPFYYSQDKINEFLDKSED